MYTEKGDVSYRYNGDGLMTERTGTDGVKTRYYYDDRALLVAEGTISASTVTITVGYVYDANGQLRARQIPGESGLQTYWTNGHGDVTEIRNAAGETLNRYTYDVWGNPIIEEETVPNVLRYSGEYWDQETGLQYLRARWYDPNIGRFINEDTYEGEKDKPGTLNLYAYVENEPIRYVDPDGNKRHAVYSAEGGGSRGGGAGGIGGNGGGGKAGSKGQGSKSASSGGRSSGSSTWDSPEYKYPSLPPGKPGNVVKNKLDPHEYKQAQEIVSYRGGTFVGADKKSAPGIDGTLNGIPVQLKVYSGNSPSGVLNHATKAEAKAAKAGYSGIELYIDAKGVNKGIMVDFIKNGPLSKIPSQGVIKNIYIYTEGGWVSIY